WYLPRALAAARRVSGHDEVTLAGYCLGGVIAALYAAGHEDARVRNLILMATPVDYTEMGAMVALLREGRLNPDEMVDETGNVPGNVHQAVAERDNAVPPPAVEPVMTLVGDPARREELRLPGGHVTFGTGGSAVKHTMPKLTSWIIDHSDTPERGAA